jgi:hypothetical protein
MVDGTRSTRTRRRMRSVFGSAQRFRGPRYLEERADPALAIWSSPTVLRPASQPWALTWDRIRRGRRVDVAQALG